VAIDDLDIKRVTVPETEAQPPLVVDANAPLAVTVASQQLETIGDRFAQVFGTCGDIEIPQSSHCPAQDILWQSPRTARGEQPFRVLVGEAPYHPGTPVYLVDSCPPTINKMFISRKPAECAHV
jgi:hypothetical protein